jgi:SAM-dependent methyltransferase
MVFLNRLRGAGLKMRLLHPLDELWDRRLGVRTIGWRPNVGNENDPNVRIQYLPTSYSVLRRVLRRASVGRGDVFVDLGSGMGRAVFVASDLGARRAVGVEIDEALVNRARANLTRSRLRAREVEFVHAPAETYSLEQATVIFMYHPFGAGTMTAVAENIAGGLKKNPRNLRVVYLNPQCSSVLDALPCLERFDHWVDPYQGDLPLARWQRAGGTSVTFWRSALPGKVA